MSQTVLVTGATGKQGGAVIDALFSPPYKNQFSVLAVTRNPSSSASQTLLQKHPGIKLVSGNLDDVPKLFENVLKEGNGSIWGVYSVQISMGKGVTLESEVKQGKALIDESLKNGVKMFVYSSVERGGDERSWENPTPIEHFLSKWMIEKHLRSAAEGNEMGWTILRPVAFMDNLVPGFESGVFLTALRDTLKGKKLQWVATCDIGIFAAKAFVNPGEWRGKAVGLAGDELSFDELSEAFLKSTGSPARTTFWVLGSALKWGIAELGRMLDWFAAEGYKADIEALRKIHPGLLNFKAWLEEKSGFETKG
ncbi:hypothetical protein B0J14DRAFT_605453 [Halenospora varia]|nr:hypothetical protein B0J14DRAFT_605453 [Halenospora varia]